MSSSSSSSSGNNGSSSNNNNNSNQDAKKETKPSVDEESIKNVTKLLSNERDTKRATEEITKERKFWDNQPVPKIYEKVKQIGEIEHRTLEQVSTTPLTLPKGYEWYNLNVNDEEDLNKLYNLLEGNYVEDDDAMFRFAYPKEFLKWALTPPGFRNDWHVIVRTQQTGLFVGFIAAIPMDIKLKEEEYKENVKMVEINFLCVHKKLREKRLAPTLIAEVTRRVNLQNIWQAIYTAGTLIPRPISKARYYHRSLNPEKLIDIKFSIIPPGFQRNFSNPMEMTKKYYKLNEKDKVKGMRALKEEDCEQACDLLNRYLDNFKVAPHFTLEEFKHWFLFRENVIYSYVIVNDNNQVLDFISFYHLPSTIIGNQKYKVLKAAYLFFYAPMNTNIELLLKSLLIEAQMTDFDVFNCVNIMDNSKFLEKLKFGTGDGYLYYYLFNFKFPDLDPKEVGLTML
ncbi:hypothetical protein ABK040_005591 [Willaertia magna]